MGAVHSREGGRASDVQRSEAHRKGVYAKQRFPNGRESGGAMSHKEGMAAIA